MSGAAEKLYAALLKKKSGKRTLDEQQMVDEYAKRAKQQLLAMYNKKGAATAVAASAGGSSAAAAAVPTTAGTSTSAAAAPAAASATAPPSTAAAAAAAGTSAGAIAGASSTPAAVAAPAAAGASTSAAAAAAGTSTTAGASASAATAAGTSTSAAIRPCLLTTEEKMVIRSGPLLGLPVATHREMRWALQPFNLHDPRQPLATAYALDIIQSRAPSAFLSLIAGLASISKQVELPAAVKEGAAAAAAELQAALQGRGQLSEQSMRFLASLSLAMHPNKGPVKGETGLVYAIENGEGSALRKPAAVRNAFETSETYADVAESVINGFREGYEDSIVYFGETTADVRLSGEIDWGP